MSQECTEGPWLEQCSTFKGGLDTFIVHCDYETESGPYAWTKLTFSGVVVLSYTEFILCTVDQIDAYDKVVEIQNSAWLNSAVGSRRDEIELVHHYRMFFSEAGCYDIAAEKFEPPTV